MNASLLTSSSSPLVSIAMGSRSDWPTMQRAAELLSELEVPHEARVVSAHRTPQRLGRYAAELSERGICVVIAGAGGAAHLPGMIAAYTSIPVLGVPVKNGSLLGVDALLSICQMPMGVPVGTLAIGEAGAVNAGLLAASIVGVADAGLRERVERYRREQTERVPETVQ